jgi:hypothetical protein
MNNAFLMHYFDPLYHLNGNMQNGFEVKLSSALLE